MNGSETPYFHEVLDRWTETGMSSAEALREIQQDRLIDLVRRARCFVPHYRAMDLAEPEADVDAAPFIRYRIGDLGTRSKHACGCGRPGDVFLDVDGRVEDYVVTPAGRWIGRLDQLFKDQLDIAEARIVQEEAASIEVLVVPRASFDTRSKQRLLKEIRSRPGDSIHIELRRVDTIPRKANGKFRAVKATTERNVE